LALLIKAVKESGRKKERRIMNSPNYVAILGILAEMARCLKENIGKVHVTPIDAALTRNGTADALQLLAGVSKL
jgi:hypothetical protein